ncbi:hypothetical protein GGR56DRAFT_641304 [Xylariaceae sp. FL0804]|nr:hypothetical protein GGR56DRAFT_641304 [Xylariaceae sp. FL0804]
MASLAAGIVDPTKAGRYPVVLSDALLGKTSKEAYTGIRHNHKPSLSSSTAPHQARIKPASSSKGNTYDLSFQDDGGRYEYNGTRGSEDGKYVLIFDAERQVFVLHKVDSMFNMNLVRTPSNSDAEGLRRQYPQLEAHKAPLPPAGSDRKTAKEAPRPKKPAPKQDRKAAGLVMPEKRAPSPPKPAAPAPKPARKPKVDSEEDESSDDDLLTIEDPGGVAPAPSTGARDFSPGFMDRPRRFSEFVQQQNEDADGEDEDDEDEHFRLPSPLGNGGIGRSAAQPAQVSQHEHEEEDEDEEDEEMQDVGAPSGAGEAATADADGDLDEMDLEAVLQAELDQEESDVSEEE